MKKKNINKNYIDRKWYYYLRNVDRVPVISVVLIRDVIGKYHRGVSICSYLDRPVKNVGRKKALARAMKAMGSGKSQEPILRSCAGFDVDMYTDSRTKFPTEYYLDEDVWCAYKSSYDTDLTEFENMIVNKEDVRREQEEDEDEVSHPTILSRIRKFFVA